MRWLALALLVAASCTSTPRPKTALEYLTFAQTALEQHRSGRARNLLESVDESSFKGEDLERYKALLAETYNQGGDWSEAFDVIEDFARKYPTSRYRPRIEEIEFECGRRLAATGWTWLGLWSDLDRARHILEHFVTYYSRSRFVPEALRILGEAAYQSADYELAIERFGQLAQRAPLFDKATQARQQRSSWGDLAAFRIAMSHFKLIEGPDYDSGQMERARQELAGYLRGTGTNPDFIEEARQALAKTLLWIEEKELRVARYYLTIDQPKGARTHIERVLAKPDAVYRQKASAMLAECDELARRLAADKGR